MWRMPYWPHVIRQNEQSLCSECLRVQGQTFMAIPNGAMAYTIVIVSVRTSQETQHIPALQLLLF
jgi:hypothetical protein